MAASAVRNYGIITASYLGFTLTDGALRMLVLLHFFKLGYSPFTLAFLFLLYEAAGIFANLFGGWLATRFGIPRMLAVGQALQITGLVMLAMLDGSWGTGAAVSWVIAAQGLCGIAKDVTKTASKAAIKAAEAQSGAAAGTNRLFTWVAWFTGSKNAVKGLGFFLGGLLLETIGFQLALLLLAALLAGVLVAGLASLPRTFGQAKASKSFAEMMSKSRAINILAAARILLFSARDVWFVVGLPVYLYANGWRFLEVGTFLAIWTIAYGAVQALAPLAVKRSTDGLSSEVPAIRMWAGALTAIPVALLVLLVLPGIWRPDLVVAIGLGIFGIAFAINSSLHSYLILAYAGSEKAAEDVGFYYAANASGRFMGTLLSGLLYQAGGMSGCLLGSAAMLAGAWVLAWFLPQDVHDPRLNRFGASI
jgi:predicted MFS family arabinose efflux permease